MGWPAQIGTWEVGAELGAGGTAEVRAGTGRAADGRVLEVALKRPLQPDDAAINALLRSEGRLLASIRHRNVVGVVDLIEGAPPVLVLERMHGRTLGERVGVLPVDKVVAVVGQAAVALTAVHAAANADGPLGIVHRDVSPENLFITDDGIVKLFDFNVACWRGRPQEPGGAAPGRAAYMAPEQARGELVDDRADVFSLGVVLWELLTGERLFWRGNTIATLRALVDEPIASLAERKPELPPTLHALVDRMLDRDRRRRPSAAEVEATLRAR
jgi:serine/threonine-protein kinase